MKAALYLRVSTDKQTTENQREPLEHLARRLGFAVTEVVQEVESGAKTRPLLDALTQRARRAEVDAVFVWALDRLGRSTWEVVDRVRAFDLSRCRLVSLQETWLDTGGPARELLLAIFAWVASQERERLRDRTRAGLVRAKAAGKRLGRPSASPLAVAQALALVDAGQTARQAAQAARLSVPTVRRALRARKGVKNAPSAEA